ncbi:MAG: SET domain-containing protein-lysine N-methyltransferase [Desulfobacteraceae bacterium]|nr:SET domain-containing protein-lysine N-methyltransferase [Desulfobacteraceae bacterium]
MIHPDTTIKNINPIIGNGVFALKDIPKGTIIVARDTYDLVINENEFLKLDPVLKNSMETYMYRDKNKNFVLSWDHAKYMNHSCCSNTMMTDYDLEIAVRDIKAGEEITTEYGILNIVESYEIYCGCKNCRKILKTDDLKTYGDIWDQTIKESLLLINTVAQPLITVLSKESKKRIEELLKNPELYSSVKNLSLN